MGGERREEERGRNLAEISKNNNNLCMVNGFVNQNFQKYCILFS